MARVIDLELGKERMKVCKTCPKFLVKTRQCAICKCFVDVKTTMVNKHCPKGKWENGLE